MLQQEQQQQQQQMALAAPEDTYLTSRAEALHNVEATIHELGGIFQQLAVMVRGPVSTQAFLHVSLSCAAHCRACIVFMAVLTGFPSAWNMISHSARLDPYNCIHMAESRLSAGLRSSYFPAKSCGRLQHTISSSC